MGYEIARLPRGYYGGTGLRGCQEANMGVRDCEGTKRVLWGTGLREYWIVRVLGCEGTIRVLGCEGTIRVLRCEGTGLRLARVLYGYWVARVLVCEGTMSVLDTGLQGHYKASIRSNARVYY
jgi:hypothetical protein